MDEHFCRGGGLKLDFRRGWGVKDQFMVRMGGGLNYI